MRNSSIGKTESCLGFIRHPASADNIYPYDLIRARQTPASADTVYYYVLVRVRQETPCQLIQFTATQVRIRQTADTVYRYALVRVHQDTRIS
jgi:hypothetical protein